MPDSTSHSPTPFDDAFKTLQERAPFLMLPVVNEIFGTDYDIRSETILQMRNEHHTIAGKRYEDSHFRIGGMEFHLECQSTNDSAISLRIIEYDFADALGEAYATGKHRGKYELVFARSCILNLRGKKPRMRYETLLLKSPVHQKLRIKIPAIYVQSYGLEEILEKKLFLFAPFYLMRYERQLKRKSKRASLPDETMQDFQKLADGIQKYFTGTDRDYCRALLGDLIREVLEAIIPAENEKMRNEVKELMGGHQLVTPTTIILDRGIRQGIQMEQANTELERQRADNAEKELAILKERLRKYEAL